MNKKQEIIRGHLTCTCNEFYKSRNRPDPTCFLCGYGPEMEMMMDEVIHAFVKHCEDRIGLIIPNSEIGKFNLEIK